MPDTRRLFVAVAPPDPLRRRIVLRADELRRATGPSAAELRWIAPENVHVTLQFLGAVPEPTTLLLGLCCATLAYARGARR